MGGVAVDADDNPFVWVVVGGFIQSSLQGQSVKGCDVQHFNGQGFKVLYCLFSSLFDEETLLGFMLLFTKKAKGLALEYALEEGISCHGKKGDHCHHDGYDCYNDDFISFHNKILTSKSTCVKTENILK